MNDKDINNLKEMLVDFNEYSTDYTKTRCRELEETIENTLKEIERLNNIINELEKWLVEWREMLDCPDFYEEGIIDCINDTLTKLQELKGSDKE